MASEVRVETGYDDDVERAGGDRPLTPGAHVVLAGVVGLDRVDEHVLGQPRNPHATRAAVIRTKTTTSTTSIVVRRCSRNGLKPMREW